MLKGEIWVLNLLFCPIFDNSITIIMRSESFHGTYFGDVFISPERRIGGFGELENKLKAISIEMAGH